MTEKFPELNEMQVAMLVADTNTGIVLNEYFEYATDPSQKVYSIFDNIDDALRYAKALIAEKKTVECCIYEQGEKLLYLLDIKNIIEY